jgi:hypothetical protein
VRISRISEDKACLETQGFGLKTQGFGLKTQGFGLKTQGFGLKTQGFGLKTQGFPSQAKQPDPRQAYRTTALGREKP